MQLHFACCLVASLVAISPAPVVSQGRAAATGPVVEIRSYNLKPGTRDRFHERFVVEALPLLNRAKIDVVAYGPSLHDADSYYLIRAFPGIEERQASEDAFYGSEAWTKGPREAVLADIDSYTTVVVRLDDAALEALRKRRPEGSKPEGSKHEGSKHRGSRHGGSKHDGFKARRFEARRFEERCQLRVNCAATAIHRP